LKRAFVTVFIMLLTVFIALSPSSILYAKAADDAEHVLKSEVLEVIVTENITFSSNGYADFELLISVPNSSLAGLYREALAANNYKRLDEEVPIPEYRLIKGYADGFVSQSFIPVRSEFLNSLCQEQLLLLGFATNVTRSSMVPRSRAGEFKVFVKGYAWPLNASLNADNRTMNVRVGLMGEKAVNILLMKLSFAQLFLKSQNESQRLEFIWTTRIAFPKAEILNEGELDGRSWTVDLGGVRLNTYTYVEGHTVILSEETVVDSQNVTLTREQAIQAFDGYKTLEIKYQAPPEMKTIQCPMEKAAEDWTWDWYASWCWRIPFSHTGENFKIFAGVVEELNLHGHISIGTIYEAWMEFGSRTTVIFQLSGAFNRDWEPLKWTIAKYYFHVFCFPVETSFDASVGMRVNFNVEAELLASVEFEGRIKAGLTDSSIIFENKTDAKITGLETEFAAGLYVRPYMRLSLNFYLSAVKWRIVGGGPYIELGPYFDLAVKAEQATISWSFSTGLGCWAGAKLEVPILRWKWCPFEQTLYERTFYSLDGSGKIPLPIHDVAVEGISHAAYVDVGSIVDVNVTISNHGNYAENVTIYGSCLRFDGFPLAFFPVGGVYSVRPKIQYAFTNSSPEYANTIINIPWEVAPKYVPIIPTPQIQPVLELVLPRPLIRLTRPMETLGTIVLPARNATTFTYKWNTTGLEPGYYVWLINASIPQDDLPENNGLRGHVVQVLRMGDLAVTAVNPYREVIYEGTPLKLNVTVQNKENRPQNATLEIYYNRTVGEEIEWIKLGECNFTIKANETKVLSFTLNTVGMKPSQSYIITASVESAYFDKNITDNINECYIRVNILGDVNSDNKVDLMDLVVTAKAFGSFPGHPRWNPIADVNEDNKINIVDLVTIATKFGTHYP
jgi:hypothetical protein